MPWALGIFVLCVLFMPAGISRISFFNVIVRVIGGFLIHSDADAFKILYMLLWGKTRNTRISWIFMKEDFGDLVYGMILNSELYY